MASIRIAAIFRAGIFSPNHIGTDAAIMQATVDQLRRRGCEVVLYNEDQFLALDIEEKIIVNMCRRPESLEKLQKLEDEGALVINSPFGIENCIRDRMTRLLLGNGIPYPDSLIVATDTNILPRLKESGIDRCWIKRGTSHAIHKEDVHYCRHAEEAQEILHEFFYRGINEVVINRHLEGDLIKFYGLRDDSFFYWFYPLEYHHSKFSDELINGKPAHLWVNEEEMRRICMKAADVTGVTVYGGDCIVDPDGTIKIIDFNDWPSFAPCREEAAPYIAKTILGCVREWQRSQNKSVGGKQRRPMKAGSSAESRKKKTGKEVENG